MFVNLFSDVRQASKTRDGVINNAAKKALALELHGPADDLNRTNPDSTGLWEDLDSD